MSNVCSKEYINASQRYRMFFAKAKKNNRIDPTKANEMQKEIIDLCNKYHIACKRRFYFYSADETTPCEHSGILRASEFIDMYNASQKTRDESEYFLLEDKQMSYSKEYTTASSQYSTYFNYKVRCGKERLTPKTANLVQFHVVNASNKNHIKIRRKFHFYLPFEKTYVEPTDTADAFLIQYNNYLDHPENYVEVDDEQINELHKLRGKLNDALDKKDYIAANVVQNDLVDYLRLNPSLGLFKGTFYYPLEDNKFLPIEGLHASQFKDYYLGFRRPTQSQIDDEPIYTGCDADESKTIDVTELDNSPVQEESKPMLKMKSENTLYDELLKKIPESTDVYSIRITGQDLHKLTEILNSPATSTDYQVEVIDHRIRITGMYDVAARNLKQAILNCGVTDEALKTLMPEINKLAASVSTSTKVIVED